MLVNHPVITGTLTIPTPADATAILAAFYRRCPDLAPNGPGIEPMAAALDSILDPRPVLAALLGDDGADMEAIITGEDDVPENPAADAYPLTVTLPWNPDLNDEPQPAADYDQAVADLAGHVTGTLLIQDRHGVDVCRDRFAADSTHHRDVPFTGYAVTRDDVTDLLALLARRWDAGTLHAIRDHLPAPVAPKG